MKKVSIVIPTLNEKDNIVPLIERIAHGFSRYRFTYTYELIFIDDHSTDGTHELLKNLRRFYPLEVYLKLGKKGKAYSLSEGFSYAKGQIFAMVDADNQYPAEEIPQMVEYLVRADVVVGHRKTYHETSLRKFFSKAFQMLFGKLLFGLSHDVQSGLKVFKQEVWKTVCFVPRSAWTFDLEFLHRAHEAGFTLENYALTFAKRPKGQSKVPFLKTAVELSIHAVLLRFQRMYPQRIPSVSSYSAVGAGIGYKKRQFITHTLLPHQRSAVRTLDGWQQLFCLVIGGAIVGSFWLSPFATIVGIVALLSFIYFADFAFNVSLVLRSLHLPQEISFSQRKLDELDEKSLPDYTILCPLYQEADVLPQFLAAVAALDYPKDKLDVILLFEEDDTDSIAHIAKMTLPSYVRTIVVPYSEPKTKPKACNYGLSLARGEYLVIYDAEDVPDRDQIKKAYLGFQQVQSDVICLQAKLNYYNVHQNLLTRFFTAEYSLWFDLTLIGLQSLNTTIPLGGTSNHFKTDVLKKLHGWDPFNVAEDADLGVRLFREGYKTAIIDSTTYEEASSTMRNWLRQRSRWLKGYMQTFLVHNRFAPPLTYSDMFHYCIFQLVVGGKIAFILINPILWVATIGYFAAYEVVGPTIDSVYPQIVFYMAAASLIFGNFLFMYNYMIGCMKRKHYSIVKYVFLVPVYWMFMSVACGVALYQLFSKPHYWEKTIHGFHLRTASDDTVQPVVTKTRKESIIFPQPRFLPDFARFAKTLPEMVKTQWSMVLTAALHSTAMVFLYTAKRTLRTLENIIADFVDLFGKTTHKEKETDTFRILIFNWRDTKHIWAGGAEVYIHELAKRLVGSGHTVTLFCGNDSFSPRNQVVDGVFVIRRGGVYMVYFWAIVYYLFKLRKECDIVIDCENGIPFFTPLYVRKRVFLLLHHVHQEVFREHLPPLFSQLALFLEGKLMPFLYKHNTVITISESSKTAILSLGLAQHAAVEIVTPGINTDSFFSAQKTKHPSVIYLGRLKPYKNVDVALRAFARVVKKHTNAEFIIVGEGESMSNLTRLVAKLKLAGNVTFYGRLPEKHKVLILAKSWVMIQPSSLEGWGITVIEANACMTPVVASNVPGLRDSIVNGETGILVPPRHVEQFADALRLLIEDKEKREYLSKIAYAWAQNFSWEKSAYAFLQILSREISARYGASLKRKIALANKQIG